MFKEQKHKMVCCNVSKQNGSNYFPLVELSFWNMQIKLNKTVQTNLLFVFVFFYCGFGDLKLKTKKGEQQQQQ